jgi:diazepam-binding inhibitor (GABA receptor modulating acyl-CoA-binding protein)
MSLQAEFEDACAVSKILRPDNKTILKMYALYNQGTKGDIEGPKPDFADLKGRAKYNAWAELRGTSRDDAMQQYIYLIEELKKDL